MNIWINIFRLHLTRYERDVFDKILMNSNLNTLSELKNLFKKYRNDRDVISNYIYMIYKDEDKRSIFLTKDDVKICSDINIKLDELNLLIKNSMHNGIAIQYYIKDTLFSLSNARSRHELEVVYSSLNYDLEMIKMEYHYKRNCILKSKYR